MVKIINLTPDSIKLLNSRDEIIYIWPSALSDNILFPRIREEVTGTSEIDGIPIEERRIKEIWDLPSFQPGVYYIVSEFIAQRLKRPDLLVPDVVKDGQGKVIGCSGFIKIT